MSLQDSNNFPRVNLGHWLGRNLIKFPQTKLRQKVRPSLIGVLLVSLSLSDQINHFFVVEAFGVAACSSCILMDVCKQKESHPFRLELRTNFGVFQLYERRLIHKKADTFDELAWINICMNGKSHEDDESTIFIENSTWLKIRWVEGTNGFMNVSSCQQNDNYVCND